MHMLNTSEVGQVVVGDGEQGQEWEGSKATIRHIVRRGYIMIMHKNSELQI